MKELQFYKYAALVLLLLNVSMIAFFFFTAPPMPPQTQDNRQKVGNVMNLDQQQHDQFLQFAEQHGKQMKQINRKQRNLLNIYFNILTDSISESNHDTLLFQIRDLEQQKIESTYDHFQDVKSILRPEQYGTFKIFVDRVIKRIMPTQGKRPLPPKGR